MAEPTDVGDIGTRGVGDAAPARSEFLAQMHVLAGRYPSLVFLIPDREDWPVEGISGSLGDRSFRMNASHAHWISAAVGMACVGKIVVIAADRNLLAGKFREEIRHVAGPAHQNLTLVAFPPPSAESPRLGKNAPDDLACMRASPGVDVYAPADLSEFRQVLAYCVTRHTTSYIRCPGEFGEDEVPPVFSSDFRFSPGVWTRLRDGDDLSIVSCGHATLQAIQAAQQMASQAVQCSVVHAGSIHPFDRDAIVRMARRTRRMIACEYHSPAGGLGSLVAETLAETGLPVRLLRIGLTGKPDRGTSGAEEIVRAAMTLLKPEGRRSRHT